MTLMDETRTLDQINQDYTQACSQLGDVIVKSEQAIQMLKEKIQKLQVEASQIEAKSA